MFKPEKWVGKQFKCTETGEIFTVPSDVRPGDFYQFGNCFIDVGDGYYSRMGGSIIQIQDSVVDPDHCRDAAIRHWENTRG